MLIYDLFIKVSSVCNSLAVGLAITVLKKICNNLHKSAIEPKFSLVYTTLCHGRVVKFGFIKRFWPLDYSVLSGHRLGKDLLEWIISVVWRKGYR